MERGSRLILSLDPRRGEGLDRLASIVSGCCEYIWGVKVGLPFLLSYGVEGVERVASLCGSRLIADLKLADIGEVMVRSVEHLEGLVYGVIAHAFVGAGGALEYLKGYLDSRGIKLILVLSMSHPGSSEVVDGSFEALAGVARRVSPWGVVVGARNTGLIRAARAMSRDWKILSPGIGAQGAPPGTALCSGADYEIVGRLITESGDPASTARSLHRHYSRLVEEGCGTPASS